MVGINWLGSDIFWSWKSGHNSYVYNHRGNKGEWQHQQNDNNSEHFPQSTYCVPDTVFNYHPLIKVILVTTLWGRYYQYPHFLDEETEVMEITQGQKGSKWQSWNLGPDNLVTESVF